MLSGTEYTAISGTLAEFTDSRGLGYSASNYSAIVDWGDGTTPSTFSVTSSDNNVTFDIGGSHTYTHFGDYPIQVFISDPDGLIAIVDSTANIADAPLIGGALTPPAATQGVKFNPVVLYHFSDSDPNAVASDFTATITWSATAWNTVTSTSMLSLFGRIVANSNGGFDVYGTHEYTSLFSGGTFGVSVTDNSGGATCGASIANFTDIPPAATSINCTSNQLAVGATSLQFTVNFSEPVTGVDTSDFALSGGNSSGTISSVTGSGSSYTVTVTGVSGNGTLGLSLVDDDSIQNAYSTPLGGFGVGNGNAAGQQYALSSQFYWHGGSGNFSDAGWHVGSASGPLLAWVNGADATFPAGTGTVAIAGQVTADSLTFQGDGAVLQMTATTDSLALLGSGYVTVSSGTAEIDVVLSGSIGLTKLGAGTLFLGAADTYTGVTNINVGTLQLGDSEGSGSIENSSQINSYATVIISAGTTFNAYHDFYSYGAIQNYGSIHSYGMIYAPGPVFNQAGGSIVVESGGLMLSWTETENYGSVEAEGALYGFGVYNGSSGTTTIDAGGGFITSTATALTGPITDNGALVFWDGGQDINYSGTISGQINAGSSGNSIITLSGDNRNFTGLIGVYAGTLRMGANDPYALGSGGAYLLMQGGTLDLNGNDLTVAAYQSGGSGAGTITDYSSTAGTSTLTVLMPASNSAMTFATITDGPYRHVAFVVSNDGSPGTPSEYFVSVNSYTGGTTIGPNTVLFLGYGGTNGTIAGNVIDNGTLVFCPATTTFSGSISGSGNVLVEGYWGSGVLVLSGVSTVSGGVAIYAGTLDVTGSIANCTITVYAGETLCGSGTVGDVSVPGGTVIAGDNGTGILTTGNLTLSRGAQYVATINGGTAGTGYTQTQVNGQVSLGGATLELSGSGAGSGSGPIVLIESTGGVSGTFAGLSEGATVTYGGVTYHISYDYNPNGGVGDDVALIPA